MDSRFYKEVLDAIADGVYFLDLSRTITFWNKSAERLTGYKSEEVLGRNCMDNLLRHVDEKGKELCKGKCPMMATMKDGVTLEASVFMHHKLGHRVPVFVRSSPMRDETGKIVGAVEIFSENSKQLDVVREMEELRQEVLVDPLTDVGNRRYGDLTIERLEEARSRGDVQFGALFADIDHFKNVNDIWGHLVGDKVLTMIAATIKNVVRPMDRVCRWGGEEFLVLVVNTSPEELASLAERLRLIVSKTWLEHEGEHVRATISVGGAVSRPGESPMGVVNRADRQMYLCKQGGRNRISIDGLEG